MIRFFSQAGRLAEAPSSLCAASCRAIASTPLASFLAASASQRRLSRPYTRVDVEQSGEGGQGGESSLQEPWMGQVGVLTPSDCPGPDMDPQHRALLTSAVPGPLQPVFELRGSLISNAPGCVCWGGLASPSCLPPVLFLTLCLQGSDFTPTWVASPSKAQNPSPTQD